MFERKQPLISLDAYRHRKSAAQSASIALSRLEDLRPAMPTSFIEDHRLAFLAAAEHHNARALCLLLNKRTVSAGLHHLSALLFRNYAMSDAMSRLCFIWAHMNDTPPTKHAVHMNATIFFRAMIEAFYHEHAKETRGEQVGQFRVIDNEAFIVALFCKLGYEQRYNTILETYNVNLTRSQNHDLQLMQRQHSPTANS